MPVLIEDIFLREDCSGEGDYDLLPFYDLDNYDLDFEDSFIVYDATFDGNTERWPPSSLEINVLQRHKDNFQKKYWENFDFQKLK